MRSRRANVRPKVHINSDVGLVAIHPYDICNDDEEGDPEACADEGLSDATHCNIPH